MGPRPAKPLAFSFDELRTDHEVLTEALSKSFEEARASTALELTELIAYRTAAAHHR